jgi:anaphase-promoting complex subunit 8
MLLLCRAADLANALDIDISGQFSHPDDSISSAGSDGKARINDFTISFYGQLSPSELATTFLAKTYFDTREFQRCAHTLKDCTGLLPTFLRCYATYLVRRWAMFDRCHAFNPGGVQAGERSKEEAQPDLFGTCVCLGTSLPCSYLVPLRPTQYQRES